ncbi:IS66 family transposase [Escherichia coli]|nr:IS66 family transposase [Escherichia coli]
MSSSLPDDINALKRLLAEQEALNRALQEKLNDVGKEIDHICRHSWITTPDDELQPLGRVSRRIIAHRWKADHKALKVITVAIRHYTRSAYACVVYIYRCTRRRRAFTHSLLLLLCGPHLRPIERGIAGPGLLARVLISKYAEHTPLYRQSEMYGRQGVELSRSLLSGWVDACCRLLSPLEEALQDYVLTDGKLHADDTPVPVLLPGNKKTKTGRLWTYVRDDRNAGSTLAPAVWFAYSPDRKGIHPQTHLAGFSGVLQADAYAGFNELYRDGRITEAACWAHARRKIHDVHVRTPSALTEEALKRIGELYAIEAEIRGMTAEQRLAERQLKTKPLLKSLESWLREKMKTLSRHSELAKAFAYALNQWPALTYYADDGWAEADNNIAENALRMVSLGRKNYLFFGSDHGGERGALLYSLIGTCKLNGVEPESYLRYVLDVIADWPINRVGELLPLARSTAD